MTGRGRRRPRALIPTTTGSSVSASRSRSSVHPAGFLASNNRTRTPPASTEANRPSTSARVAMAASASASSTPRTPAATAAMAALARLQRPGSARRIGSRRPSARLEHVVAQGGVGNGSAKSARARPIAGVRCRAGRSGAPVSAGAGEDDAAAARRASHRVVSPQLPGRHPHGARRRRRAPHDERVIGVGHHGGVRAGQRAAPALRHHAHLAHPVELVARQVQQRHDLRAHRVGHGSEVSLVHLEHGRLARARRRQGAHQSGGEVGSRRRRRHLRRAAQGGGEQAGRGGLAVGAAHQRHAAPDGEGGEEVRLEHEPHPAADHRTTAEAQPARRRTHRHRRPAGQTGPHRRRPVCGRGRHDSA